jgi:DNA-binding MarR family transcriptional regulator
MEKNTLETYGYRIAMSLRRITHAVDAYSRTLAAEYNVTGPQLTCLYHIARNEPTTLSEISTAVCLSAGTVNGILDRLKTKGLIQRRRMTKDRRKVMVRLTEKGKMLVDQAPSLLHSRMAEHIQTLPEFKQAAIALSLEEIVKLMELEQSPTGTTENAS